MSHNFFDNCDITV